MMEHQRRQRRPGAGWSAGALLAAVLAALLAGCAGGAGAEAPPAVAAADLTVHRGDFSQRLLLTGELEAADAWDLTVPRSPTWRVEIRWMAEDGSEVHAGDKVVEFDNSQFTSDLEEKKLAASEKANALARKEAETKSTEAEKTFHLEEKLAALAKAKIDAAVPAELLPARDYQEKQLALKRAQVEVAKARQDLAAARESDQAELAIQRIELAKARREIRVAQQAVDTMSLKAPADGVLVIQDHPWEGRKIEVGDTVFVGLTIARIPDLSTMRVKALLSDVDDGKVAVGMPVECTLDAYPGQRFAGRVTAVAPVAREAPGTSLQRFIGVTVALDRVDIERMRPGMSVRVEVERSSDTAVLLAPRAGLDLAAAPPRARLASGGETAVRLGPCNAEECVVEEGLAEGDRLRPATLGEGA